MSTTALARLGWRLAETFETLRARRVGTGEKAEIKAELFKLPLNVNSMRARKHQEALHKQLDDVENSIKIFERPVVYIQA